MWAYMIVSCGSTTIPSRTFILTDAMAQQRVTFQLTMTNAVDQAGVDRTGQLVFTSIHDGTHRMLHVQANGATAPIWLQSIDNQAVFVMNDQSRHIIDGSCTRDAIGFPPIALRDILGPLQGFVLDDTRWQSTRGGDSWQRFVADAQTDAQDSLTSMHGEGRGKLLLPGGDVITADISWAYEVEPYPVTLVVPDTSCEALAFQQISFPDEFGISTTMSGALLFQSPYPLIATQNKLMKYWQSAGLAPTISQQNDLSSIIEINQSTDVVRVFLTQTQTNTTDITVIQLAP